MDLYLIKNCHFFIGNQSGPVEVANMFLKPILLTNMTDIFQILPRKKIDRGLFKKVFDNKKNLFITLHEYISSNFLNFNPESEIVDFKFQENSAAELYDAGLEYLKLINNNNFILSKKQIGLNQYLKNRFKEFYQQQKLNKVLKKNYLESDKYIKWMRSYDGAFLNTNFKK
jgi:putative glycosyltransferase (TIGR04372 family)